MDTTSGGGLATLAYYNALCDIYPGLVDCAMPEEFCIERFKDFIPIPRRTKWEMISKWSLHRIKAFLESFLKKEALKYSVCVINGGVYAGDMMDMIHTYGIKIVVIHHNYETEYHMTNKSLFTLRGLFPCLISYNEKRAYLKAEMNLFLTKPDMDIFEEVYGHNDARNYLLGVFETGRRTFKPSKCQSKKTIVVTGSLCTYQTIHSLLEFEKRYFDAFRANFPDYKLLIAGRSPSQEILDLESRNPGIIQIVGDPENMDYITDKGAIYLCTTSVGGGLKLRVMDGLKKGMAVLVHKVSARGYEQFFDSPFFKVYDNVDSFVNGLKSIQMSLMNAEKDFPNEIIKKYEASLGYESGVRRMSDIFKFIS